MKRSRVLFILLCTTVMIRSYGQTNKVFDAFPTGTILIGDVPYNNDTLHKHLLDIYMPAGAGGNVPLLIFIHGGAWLSNDKTADMGYMRKTIAEVVSNGIAIASIDYRFSTDAIFPAQVQDCNRAVSFLYDNAAKYGFDKNRFALMGFSAGGHLASLMGLSNNNKVASFFMPGTSQGFGFKAVADFYGPADLLWMPNSGDENSPEATLLGAAPLSRPDLAKTASPVSYVDKKDPPFLIIQGEKDESVPNKQSHVLSSLLTAAGVSNELIIVKDAPHYGVMFDADEVRARVIAFLKKELQ